MPRDDNNRDTGRTGRESREYDMENRGGRATGWREDRSSSMRGEREDRWDEDFDSDYERSEGRYGSRGRQEGRYPEGRRDRGQEYPGSDYRSSERYSSGQGRENQGRYEGQGGNYRSQADGYSSYGSQGYGSYGGQGYGGQTYGGQG